MPNSSLSDSIRPVFRAPLYLAAAFGLVYALISTTPQVKAEKIADRKAAEANHGFQVLRDPDILSDEAKRIRHAMMVAAMTGEIKSMRLPIEMNEIPPIISEDRIDDPVEYWRTVSGDGEGREILSILIRLFRSGFVREIQGSGDVMYVWPYFAAAPIGDLTPAQQVELLTIVTPERFNAMRETGVYDYYRIGISQDGVWHYFTDQDK